VASSADRRVPEDRAGASGASGLAGWVSGKGGRGAVAHPATAAKTAEKARTLKNMASIRRLLDELTAGRGLDCQELRWCCVLPRFDAGCVRIRIERTARSRPAGTAPSRQSDLRQRAQAERALADSGSKPARRSWLPFAVGRCRRQPPSIFLRQPELGKLESKLAAIHRDERPVQQSLEGEARLTPCNIAWGRPSLDRNGSSRAQ
jgi:hypothetical protein